MASEPPALAHIEKDRADLDDEDAFGQEGKTMDDRRFDALTRSLATGRSRRAILKSLFGGAVLGGAAASGLDRVAAQCPEGEFLCNGACCPEANNCCGGTTCCPSSQCNQTTGTCCLESEFFCGTGDNACCDIETEKCCDGVCISAALCCPSLPDCATGLTCCNGQCVDLLNDPTNCGSCAADCSAGLVCCGGQCLECCNGEGCPPCERCTTGGTCAPLACENRCEICDAGVDACVSLCPENQFCCIFGPPEDQTIECVEGDECCDSSECAACATCINGFCEPNAIICEDGLVPCCIDNQLVCTECCDDTDCTGCTSCFNGVCEPDVIVCTEGVPCCIDDQLVCAECCDDADCGSCATCVSGLCEPLALPCPLGQVNCCVDDELVCVECCHHSDCGDCELCREGVCVPDEECCVPIYGECGLLVTTAGTSPPQLDCCDGLVCCESKDGSFCAECCTDHECPKGWICCLGVCREIECCIDDILVGLDPNRRCPESCSCFEGFCDCHCRDNKDCAYGACCCKDGTCSEHCCAKGCDHNSDCAYGACCCHDGSCSDKCCKTYTPPVYELPDTGSGSTSTGGVNIAAVAAGAAAAYLAARKLRQPSVQEDAEESAAQ